MPIIYVILIYYSLCYVNYAQADQRLVFAGIQGSVNSEISFRVIKEAYSVLGIEIDYRPLPGERALRTSNAGELDGELFRIANVQRKYKNLIPIPTSINILEGVVFSKNSDLIIQNWESLREFNIGIQVGIKFAERGTQGMQRIMVDTNEQLFRMLAADRVDVAVVALTNGLKTKNQLQLTNVNAIAPSIQQFPLYHYLHKRNRALVPKLDKALQSMENAGRIKQIRKIALQELVSGTLKETK